MAAILLPRCYKQLISHCQATLAFLRQLCVLRGYKVVMAVQASSPTLCLLIQALKLCHCSCPPAPLSCEFFPEPSLVSVRRLTQELLSVTVPTGRVSDWRPGPGVGVQGCNAHSLASDSAQRIFCFARTEQVSTTETLNRRIAPPFALQVVRSECPYSGMAQRGGVYSFLTHQISSNTAHTLFTVTCPLNTRFIFCGVADSYLFSHRSCQWF